VSIVGRRSFCSGRIVRNSNLLPFLDQLLLWRECDKVPVIAEIKVRSAKDGPLLDRHSVENIVAQYVAGGAACLSVVTGRWFGGDPSLLEQVRSLTDLPVLRKDFIVSRKELEASKSLGADAVLLTRRLMRPDALARLAAEALALELVPFVEVADETELATTELPADAVLAINNRDIRIKESDDGDYHTSLRLSERLDRRRPQALVSASGIRCADEVASLINAGFDGVLIGTALLRCRDIARFLDSIRTTLMIDAPAWAPFFAEHTTPVPAMRFDHS
jgi:indole-3-glycerol phosphate synthase